MRPRTFDPTAGERARAIQEHPETPQPILDPTDPGCGAPAHGPAGGPERPQRILDPTDPECGAPMG